MKRTGSELSLLPTICDSNSGGSAKKFGVSAPLPRAKRAEGVARSISVGPTVLLMAAPSRACIRSRSSRIASVHRLAASSLPAGPPTLFLHSPDNRDGRRLRIEVILRGLLYLI